jgi:hypothetical protein
MHMVSAVLFTPSVDFAAILCILQFDKSKVTPHEHIRPNRLPSQSRLEAETLHYDGNEASSKEKVRAGTQGPFPPICIKINHLRVILRGISCSSKRSRR